MCPGYPSSNTGPLQRDGEGTAWDLFGNTRRYPEQVLQLRISCPACTNAYCQTMGVIDMEMEKGVVSQREGRRAR